MSSYLDERINDAVELLQEAYQEEDWNMVEEAVELLQAQDVGMRGFDSMYDDLENY